MMKTTLRNRSCWLWIQILQFIIVAMAFHTIWIFFMFPLLKIANTKGGYIFINPILLGLSLGCSAFSILILNRCKDKKMTSTSIKQICIFLPIFVLSFLLLLTHFALSLQLFAWAIISSICVILFSALPFLITKKNGKLPIVCFVWISIIGIFLFRWLIPLFGLNLDPEGIVFAKKMTPILTYFYLEICVLIFASYIFPKLLTSSPDTSTATR